MDKRILLLTDFSKGALNAIRYALGLYSEIKCTFYFLNTYHPDTYSTGSHDFHHSGQRIYETTTPDVEKQFKTLIQTLGPENKSPDHRYLTIAINNTLLEGVNDVIAKYDIDIVIMGSKGLTSSRTVLFGMNTVHIMENVTACPVLAVPEDVKFMPPKEIVFPTDFKTPFKRRELKYLINIAQMHDADIQVLHVKEADHLNTEQQENKQLLETLFKDVGHSFHDLAEVSVPEGINGFIDGHDSDMVAFINQKRNFFSRLVSKPLVKELGYHPRVPVLALKHRM